MVHLLHPNNIYASYFLMELPWLQNATNKYFQPRFCLMGDSDNNPFVVLVIAGTLVLGFIAITQNEQELRNQQQPRPQQTRPYNPSNYPEYGSLRYRADNWEDFVQKGDRYIHSRRKENDEIKIEMHEENGRLRRTKATHAIHSGDTITSIEELTIEELDLEERVEAGDNLILKDSAKLFMEALNARPENSDYDISINNVGTNNGDRYEGGGWYKGMYVGFETDTNASLNKLVIGILTNPEREWHFIRLDNPCQPIRQLFDPALRFSLEERGLIE